VPTYTYTFLGKDLLSPKLSKIQKAGVNGFNKIDKSRSKFTNNLSKTNSKLNNTNSGVNKLVGLAGKLGIAFGVGSIIKGVGTLGLELEQTRIKYGVLLGSVDKGNKMISKLNKFANATPFENADLQKNAELLLNFGISGKKILPTLKMLGDVSGGNKDKFNSLSLAYAQMQSTGKLMGQDLNQMINAGFNPLLVISKKTGVSMGVLKDQMSKGQISSKMIEDAFKSATSKGGLFNGMMEKISKSGLGLLSTASGKLKAKLADFSEKYLVPIIAKGLQLSIVLIDGLSKIPPIFNAIYDSVNNNKIVFGLFGVALVALNANLIISRISFLAFNIQFKAYTLWTKIATAGQWLWNAALTANPIGLVVAGIAALIAGIVLAYNKIGWFRGGLLAAWESIKGFGNAIKDYVVDRIQQMVSGITGIGKTLMLFFKGEWKQAWKTGKDAVKNLSGFGVGNGSKFINNMKATGKSAALAYKKGVSEIEAKKNKKGSLLNSLSKSPVANIGADSITGTPTTPTAPSNLKNGINAITGGGQKQTNITVTFDKLVENFTIKTQNIQQGIEQSEDALKEMLLRVLNSANQTQTSN